MPLRSVLSSLTKEAEKISILQTILDNLPAAVFCKNSDDKMRILSWNTTAEQMFGVSAEKAVGKTLHDIFPKELADKYTADDWAVIQHGKTVFFADRTTNNFQTGNQIQCRLWKTPIQTERGLLLLCIAQDTTEIKKAETETREQERRLMSISNNAPGLLYQFKMDPEGTYSFPFFTRRSSELLGVSADAIIRDPQAIISLIHKDDMPAFEASLVKTISELSPWKWEGRFWAFGNTPLWFRGASSPVKQDDGSIIWDGLLIDVTLQKEAEQKLKEQALQLAGTSKLVALGEMAAGVAHEINTPLNAILFCAEQIQSSIKANSVDKVEIEQMSEVIVETSQRIAKIVRGLKAVARDGSSDPLELTPIEWIVEQALSLCSYRILQNGINVDFVKPKMPIAIDCRAVQIGQVLLNLLNNAFDAIVDSENPWIKIEAKIDSFKVLIEVTDSGTGLTNEIRQKLFEPFFTTKGLGKGTGIGLSISQGIVKAHNGKMFLDETSPNTRFVVELPFKAESKAA